MKRILSATNTSGIPAAPSVEDVSDANMKNSVMGSTSFELLKWKASAAKRALNEFLQVAKSYDDINDHLTQSELTSMDKALEALGRV